ncbi:hypothetical protein CVT24_009607 [Panaeolus cyanescens]|uniref:Uncharacterized protein n=1 Tax=Panaeolus cyanescens TaxID=181874 RepID=A0A409YA26_9AGAR|nr:hypothetical protein CVT24_009607 [Panaeolus cyanescens]
MKQVSSPLSESRPAKRRRIEDAPEFGQALVPHCSEAQVTPIPIDVDTEKAYALSLRNQTSSAIYRLSPDILATIFEYLAIESPTTYSITQEDSQSPQGPKHRVNLNWATVSHVCHLFRSVALDCATLWTSLDLTSPKWTELQLRRCKGANLALNAPGERVPEPEVTVLAHRILSSMLGQFKMVKITMRNDESEKEAARLLCGAGVSAPQLEFLILSRVRDTNDSEETNPVAIFNGLLNGGSPRLSGLSLNLCAVSLSAPIFSPNITILEIITDFNSSPNNFGSLSDFLDALDRMSALRILNLKMVLPEPTESERDGRLSDRIIKLPFLEILDLHSEATCCELLLWRFVFPALSKVHLDCRVDTRIPPSSRMIQDMFSAIHRLWPSDNFTDIGFATNEEEDAYSIDVLEIFLDTTNPDQEGYSIEATPIFTLSESSWSKFSSDYDGGTWVIDFNRNGLHLVDLLSSMALDRLGTVRLHVDVPHAALEILSTLPTLQYMFLRQKPASQFLAYMCTKSLGSILPTESDGDNTNVVRFPELIQLRFYQVFFTFEESQTGIDNPNNQNQSNFLTVYMKDLVQFLKRRLGTPGHITKTRFYDCNVSLEMGGELAADCGWCIEEP